MQAVVAARLCTEASVGVFCGRRLIARVHDLEERRPARRRGNRISADPSAAPSPIDSRFGARRRIGAPTRKSRRRFLVKVDCAN